jgi:hypothetical protein
MNRKGKEKIERKIEDARRGRQMREIRYSCFRLYKHLTNEVTVN